MDISAPSTIAAKIQKLLRKAAELGNLLFKNEIVCRKAFKHESPAGSTSPSDDASCRELRDPS